MQHSDKNSRKDYRDRVVEMTQENKWVHTNIYRYVKQESEKVFSVITMAFIYETEEHVVYTDTIDVSHYLNDCRSLKILNEYLKTRGYNHGVSGILKNKSIKNSMQFLAEYIFDSDLSKPKDLFFGTEEECEEYIEDLVYSNLED